MLKLTILSVTLLYVIMTSDAMPNRSSRVPEVLSAEDQSRDATVDYYEPLNAILQGLRQLKNMQPHPQRQIIRNTPTTTTTSIPLSMKKRSRLSINSELKSLANLLMRRDNKRRQAQKTKLRSRLLSIGKRSMPQIQDQDHQEHVNDVTPVTYNNFFLTKLFPEISEQEMTYIIGQFLRSDMVTMETYGYQGEEPSSYEI